VIPRLHDNAPGHTGQQSDHQQRFDPIRLHINCLLLVDVD
jgi:hypothetical protein